MGYPPLSVFCVLVLTWYIVGIRSSAINRELDFLLTEEFSQFYGFSPTKDELTVIHLKDSTSRSRRSTTSTERTRVSFEAFGEEYRLELKPNSALIHPGLYAKYANEKGDVTRRKKVESRGCHYMGNVVSHRFGNNTLSAINLCNGLSGLVTTGEQNIFIRPMTESHSEEYRKRAKRTTESEYRPHLVFRQAVTDDVSADKGEDFFCGLDEKHFNLSNPNIAPVSNLPEQRRTKRSHTRKKRTTSEKHMEIMVTIDRDMVKFIEEEHRLNVIEYVLDILNVAASRFQDESLGEHRLILHVVNMVVLNDDVITSDNGDGRPAGLTITRDAQDTLLSYCSYQRFLHDQEVSWRKWDLSILLTRKNMVLGESSNLVALALPSGACNSSRQCLLCEDYGAASGIILAHEIGHTLGMAHDGRGRAMSCTPGVNIMTENRINGAGTFHWSQCSLSQYEDFLNQSQSACLDNNPNCFSDQGWPCSPVDAPLGRKYNASAQCFFFDKGLKFACTELQLSAMDRTMSDTCGVLYCVRNNNCEAMPVPSLDGTSCGIGKECREGVCIPVTGGHIPSVVQSPINGGWSVWLFTTCSRSCGGGVHMPYRICNNPMPSSGGRDCPAEPGRPPELCNTQPCSNSGTNSETESQMEYRNEQCREEHGPGYSALTLQAAANSPCLMNCLNQVTNQIRGYAPFVNGTMCGGEYDRCVGGSCEMFGCDNIMGSGRSLDICGECDGNDQTCRREGVYDRYYPGEDITVLKFANGTMRIEVINTNPNISIGLTDNDKLIIGGGVSTPQIYTYFQNTLFYSRTAQLEKITVPGPTNIDFKLMATTSGTSLVTPWSTQLSITYIYYSRVIEPVSNYLWQTTTSMECTCETESVPNNVFCVLFELSRVVDVSLCDPTRRPMDEMICNREHCPNDGCYAGFCYKWAVGEWSACTVTCGGGIQTRNIECHNTTSTSQSTSFVSHYYCSSTRPSTEQSCATETCQCPPNTCRSGQIQNMQTCQCECQLPCPSGLTQSTLTCKCVLSAICNDVIWVSPGEILEGDISVNSLHDHNLCKVLLVGPSNYVIDFTYIILVGDDSNDDGFQIFQWNTASNVAVIDLGLGYYIQYRMRAR